MGPTQALNLLEHSSGQPGWVVGRQTTAASTGLGGPRPPRARRSAGLVDVANCAAAPASVVAAGKCQRRGGGDGAGGQCPAAASPGAGGACVHETRSAPAPARYGVARSGRPGSRPFRTVRGHYLDGLVRSVAGRRRRSIARYPAACDAIHCPVNFSPGLPGQPGAEPAFRPRERWARHSSQAIRSCCWGALAFSEECHASAAGGARWRFSGGTGPFFLAAHFRR